MPPKRRSKRTQKEKPAPKPSKDNLEGSPADVPNEENTPPPTDPSDVEKPVLQPSVASQATDTPTLKLKLIVIDTDGDVHIACGADYIINVEDDDDEDNGKLPTFQVSSKPLTLASPIFKRILDPTSTFAQPKTDEGFRFVKTFASPTLLHTVLNILHYKQEQVPKETPDVKFMEELALFADEYEMSGALAMQVEKWLRGSEVWEKFDWRQVGDLGTWLLVGWVFKIDWFYQHITKHIVLEAVWIKQDDDGKGGSEDDGAVDGDENDDHSNDWIMMVATEEDSQKPTSRLAVHDRVPKSVLDQLRNEWTKRKANLEKISYHYVVGRFRIHRNEREIQRRINPSSSILEAERHDDPCHNRLINAALYDRFIEMIDIRPNISRNDNNNTTNSDDDGSSNVIVEETYEVSKLNCTIQRFLDATKLFKLDYQDAHRNLKTLKNGFFDPISDQKNRIRGFSLEK